MTALLVVVGWQAFVLLTLLIGARAGVVRVTVTRPPRPKEAKP